MARSTLPPLWLPSPLRGGYTVHPVPAPFSVRALHTSRIRLGTSSQKEMLFRRGKAISAAPIITGTR